MDGYICEVGTDRSRTNRFGRLFAEEEDGANIGAPIRAQRNTSIVSKLGGVAIHKREMLSSLVFGHVELFVKGHIARTVFLRNGALTQATVVNYGFAAIPLC
jgi:hypothetical protein